MAEITKTQKFDIRAPQSKARSELTTRILALDVGEGFEVSGVDREVLSARVQKLRREGRSFITNRLGPLHYRIIRAA